LVEKKLPLKTEINGFEYTQIQRDKYRAIYAQKIGPTRMQYEVFRIKASSPKEKMASLYAQRGKSTDHLPDMAEGFPCDSDFGVSAWSCQTLEEAKRRFQNIAPRSQVRTKKRIPV